MEIGDLLNAINSIEISKFIFKINQILEGEADLITALKVAQLSLKHRQNKS